MLDFADTTMLNPYAPSIERPKTLFFDVNETLLDLNPLTESVARVLEGRRDLAVLWFTSLLHHSLVATVGNHYRDFGQIGVATLQMVARGHGIELSEDRARQALAPIHSLPPHSDAEPALKRLKQSGFQLVALTNSPPAVLKSQLNHAGLAPYFDAALSVESVKLFKPHPETYAWALRRLQIDAPDGLLVAAHGWDIAGALWAGMRGIFIQRPGKQLYPLAEEPELTASTFGALADYLIGLLPRAVPAGGQ
ncbi:MAG: haloacid dehalogenase type II [Methylohalobius sp. ZOD2]|nr:haloacid dehalogenase type II [Methylothermaceae bacterium]